MESRRAKPIRISRPRAAETPATDAEQGPTEQEVTLDPNGRSRQPFEIYAQCGRSTQSCTNDISRQQPALHTAKVQHHARGTARLDRQFYSGTDSCTITLSLVDVLVSRRSLTPNRTATRVHAAALALLRSNPFHANKRRAAHACSPSPT